MSLEELMQVRITGATLRDEYVRDVPSAVTVFTAEQLDQLGMEYLHELLNLVPGFQFSRNGDTQIDYAYSARGRRVGGQSREILVLVDGRDFSDPRFLSPELSFSLFPLEFIERVEFIRGPSSALYGSTAVNGTINIITRKNTQQVSLSFGSQNGRTATVHGSKKFAHWQADVSLRAYGDEGTHYSLQQKNAAKLPSRDPRAGFDLNAAVGNERFLWRYTHHQLAAEDFYSLETVNNNFNANDQRFDQFAVEYKLFNTQQFSSELSLHYLYTELNRWGQIAPAGAMAARSSPRSEAPFFVSTQADAQGFRINLANDWTINDTSSVQFGGSFLKNDEIRAITRANYDLAAFSRQENQLASSASLDIATPIGLGEDQSAQGLYGQYLAQLNDATRITLGGRYDRYEDYGGHFSPRLGVVGQINHHHTLKMQYGVAFRAPALIETGVINNLVLLGNPNLTYEVVKTLDLIWQAQWPTTVISADLFFSHYDDPITVQLQGTTRVQSNASDVNTRGIELEASQEFLDYWRLRATYTRILNKPADSFREADRFASVMVNYSRERWGWNLAAVYQAERQTLGPNNIKTQLADFWFADTKVSFELADAYQLHLRVKNLFNENYATPAIGVGLSDGIPNRGRQWLLGVDWYY